MSPNELRGAPGQRAPRHDRPPTKDTDALSAKVTHAVLTLPSDVVAALVGFLSDPAAELELWRQQCREAYEAGLAEGYRRGYERGARILEAEWPAIIAPLAGPTHEELEAARFGPGGREHFGDPRPADRFPRTRLEAAS